MLTTDGARDEATEIGSTETGRDGRDGGTGIASTDAGRGIGLGGRDDGRRIGSAETGLGREGSRFIGTGTGEA